MESFFSVSYYDFSFDTDSSDLKRHLRTWLVASEFVEAVKFLRF